MHEKQIENGKTLRKTATGNDLDLIEYNNSEIASYSRANGVLSAITKGQNLIETFSYNNWNMLDNHTVSNANADIYDMSYNYSRGWHLIEKADGIKNTSDKYTYDSYYRLKEVKYDFANNTAARTDNFYQDGSNQTIATYTYDAFNRRITKTVGSTTERYTYDDWDIVEISTNSDDYTNIIDSGTDRHIAIEVTANNTSTLYYFLTDERGNVTALTDANGNVLERYRYRVYGDFEILDSQFSPKNCSNQTCYATNLHNFIWGGSLYESETGLYWMRNRYYHIDMHRFINQDPIGIWGDANNLGNGFAYVAGMVIEASDPSGLDIWIEDGTDDDFFMHQKISVTDPGNINGYKSWSFGAIFENDGILYRLPNMSSAIFGLNVRGVVYSDDSNKAGKVKIKLKTSPQQDEMARNILNRLIRSQGKYAILFTSSGTNCRGFSKKMFSMFEKGIYDFDTAKKLFNKIAGNTPDEEPDKADSDREIPNNGDGTNPESKAVEDDDSFGTNPIRSKYPEADVECSYGSCQCVSGNCSGATGENMPSDPDKDPSNAIQKILMNNILAKMLKRGESEQPPVFIDTSTGPNGAIKIYRNPYYVNKDPLKTILFDGNNGSGKPMIYRNPFVPGASYGYDSTTYEKWQQSGFIQPEVDPWLR
jgi:RHS repeat-associated protein